METRPRFILGHLIALFACLALIRLSVPEPAEPVSAAIMPAFASAAEHVAAIPSMNAHWAAAVAFVCLFGRALRKGFVRCCRCSHVQSERPALMKSKRIASRAAWFLTMGLAGASLPAVGAVRTVTSLADSGPGTLRAQIEAAAPGDTINFAMEGTITLNSQLTITNNLRIEGRTFLNVSGNNNSRVFNIAGGAVQIYSLGICNGRVVGTNGPAGSNGENVYGGGIFVASGASLVMQLCVVSNNVAIGGQGGSETELGFAGNGGNAYGGGIGSLGSVSLGSCAVVSNSAFGGLGGIAAVTNSPGVGGQGWGGALYAEGTAGVYSCAINGNRAVAGTGGGGPGGGSGGGIYNVGTMHVGTCTIANNTATGSDFDFGGGINDNGTLTVRDCTIANNEADFGGGIAGGGNFRNTVIALNSAPTGPDGVGSIISSDYNLIQDTNGLSIGGVATAHNILGQNPLLGPLSDNGGPTLTMAPLPGSPVIDKGKSTEQDQRWRIRPYDGSIPNAAGGNGADIGAFEVQPGTIYVLNTNNSGPGSLRQAVLDNGGLGGSNTIVLPGNLSGTITLTSGGLYLGAPATIIGPGADRLAISANTNGRVFTIIAGPTQISGLTIRDGLIIGGSVGQGQEGLDERGGGIYNEATLTLSNCVIRNNTVIGGIGGERHLGTVGNGGKGLGGGLYNAGGNLHLVNCVFDRNRAVGGQGGSARNGEAGGGANGLGGAICTFGGTNQMIACALMDNFAVGGAGGISIGSPAGNGGQGYGAGLYSESTVIATRCTISGGNAIGGDGGSPGSGYGGGIYNVDTLALTSCTIASNSVNGSSFDFGGGIYTVGVAMGVTNSTIAGNDADYGGGLHGNATFANTILAANTATTSGPDGDATINSFDYNLIQNFSGVNIIGATAHVIIGQDPLLGPLTENGGPTRTMALRPGSPAIDKGNSFGIATDQRGAPRPFDFASVANAGGGDSSDIGAFELGIPSLSISRAHRTFAVVRWPAHFGDFVLESAAALPTGNTGNEWTPVANTPVVSGNQLSVTESASTGNRFYRLKSR